MRVFSLGLVICAALVISTASVEAKGTICETGSGLADTGDSYSSDTPADTVSSSTGSDATQVAVSSSSAGSDATQATGSSSTTTGSDVAGSGATQQTDSTSTTGSDATQATGSKASQQTDFNSATGSAATPTVAPSAGSDAAQVAASSSTAGSDATPVTSSSSTYSDDTPATSTSSTGSYATTASQNNGDSTTQGSGAEGGSTVAPTEDSKADDTSSTGHDNSDVSKASSTNGSGATSTRGDTNSASSNSKGDSSAVDAANSASSSPSDSTVQDGSKPASSNSSQSGKQGVVDSSVNGSKHSSSSDAGQDGTVDSNTSSSADATPVQQASTSALGSAQSTAVQASTANSAVSTDSTPSKSSTSGSSADSTPVQQTSTSASGSSTPVQQASTSASGSSTSSTPTQGSASASSADSTPTPTTATSSASTSSSSSSSFTKVTRLGVRVQGDMPEWNEEHQRFLSAYYETFDEKYRAVLDTVNMASVEGALKYVQAECINASVITGCERKNSIKYVVFYQTTTVQPTAAMEHYVNATDEYNFAVESCPFMAMDDGQCDPNDDGSFPDVCNQYIGAGGQPELGFCVGGTLQDSEVIAPYPHNYWFSFPNSCPQELWDDKTDACREKYTGGMCAVGVEPDGVTCTFTYEILGYILLDDVVGITSMVNPATGKTYADYYEFCEAGGVEFSVSIVSGVVSLLTSLLSSVVDLVEGLEFWANPGDSDANAERVEKLVSAYDVLVSTNATTSDGGLMRALPTVDELAALNPSCYENSPLCAESEFGCKRSYRSQICQLCTSDDSGCEKP